MAETDAVGAKSSRRTGEAAHVGFQVSVNLLTVGQRRRRKVISVIINSGRIMVALLEPTFKPLWFVAAAWLTLPWTVK